MAPRNAPQIGLEDTLLDDATLHQTLDDWWAAKQALKGPRKAFTAINTTAKALIDQKELEDGTYRSGAFVITVKSRGEEEREFTVAAGKRTTIKPART